MAKTQREAHHGDISKDKGEKIPTAIIIGGEPTTVFSSIAPVPEGLTSTCLQELQEKGIKTVKCKTSGWMFQQMQRLF